MKYFIYSIFFGILLGSCSQQERMTKVKENPSNVIAAKPVTNTAQVAVTPKPERREKYSIDPREYYEGAFLYLQQMLDGEQPIDFKKAVFTTENAWRQDQLSYDAFNQYIKSLASVCKAWKKANPLLNYQWDADSVEVALNGAIYHVMTDTIKDRKGNTISAPYHYDFNDCFAKDNWTNMFVTKLMETHGGNCHSLPFLYKILAGELGTEANLCFLPGHIYLKQYSHKTSYYNTELTGRCFPVDAWLASSGYVSVNSIRSGLYMDTLSLKQSVAVCVNDLAKGYERKFGDGHYKFILKCCDLGLKYYPNYGELLLLKAETLKKLYQHDIALYGLNATDSKEHGKEIKGVYNEMEQTYNTLAELDYREISEPLYEHWTEAMLNGGKAENEQIRDTVVYSTLNGNKEYIIAEKYGNNVVLFNDEDTLRRIGSVIFNRITNKVEYFILKDDYSYAKELERPNEPARFMSVDPIAKKYPELTPYQFAGNMPIRYIDLDGLEPAQNSTGTNDFQVALKNDNYAGGYYAYQGNGEGGWDNIGYSTRPVTIESYETSPAVLALKKKEADFQNNPFIKTLDYINRDWNPVAQFELGWSAKLTGRDRWTGEPVSNSEANSTMIEGGVGMALFVAPEIGGGAVSAFNKLTYASEYGIDEYSTLRKLTRGTGLDVHHLIEQRFGSANNLGIVLTKDEHQIFTNAWRQEIGYSNSNSILKTTTATQIQINNAAKTIYKDYPEILNALGIK